MNLRKFFLEISSHQEVIVSFFFLFCLAIFVPTNGIGSTGVIFIWAWVFFKYPDLRRDWWKVIRSLFAVAFVYLLVITSYAFSVKAALHDGGEVLKSITLSLVVFYILQLPESVLRKSMSWVVVALTISASGILIYNLACYGFKGVLQQHFLDWYVNRNRLAVGFSLMSIFALTLVIDEISWRKSLMYSLVMVLALLAALLNDSRGAVVAMLLASASIVFAAIIANGWKKVLRFDWLAVPVLIVAIIVVYVCFNHHGLKGFVLHGDGIDTNRFIIWQTVWDRFMHSVWIGYGPHAILHDQFLINGEVMTFRLPHNIYLGLLYSSGIVGVIFWLGWFSVYLSRTRKVIKSQNRIGFYIGLGILVNVLTHGLVDFDFYALDTMTFLIVGLTLVAVRSSSKVHN